MNRLPRWAIHGAEVICTRGFTGMGDEQAPRIGQTYTIRGFDVGPGGFVAITLFEIYNKPHLYRNGLREASWDLSCFKPLYRITPQREVERELWHKLQAKRAAA